MTDVRWCVSKSLRKRYRFRKGRKLVLQALIGRAGPRPRDRLLFSSCSLLFHSYFLSRYLYLSYSLFLLASMLQLPHVGPSLSMEILNSPCKSSTLGSLPGRVLECRESPFLSFYDSNPVVRRELVFAFEPFWKWTSPLEFLNNSSYGLPGVCNKYLELLKTRSLCISERCLESFGLLFIIFDDESEELR